MYYRGRTLQMLDALRPSPAPVFIGEPALEGELRTGKLDRSAARRLCRHVVPLAKHEDDRIGPRCRASRQGESGRIGGIDRRASGVNDAS